MARLPQSLNVAAPQGARPSTAAPAATDYGLADAGAALGQLAQQRQQRQVLDDEKKAGEILRAQQAVFEPKFSEKAEAYTGREPGFAPAALADYDAHYAPVATDPTVTEGVRLALRRQIDKDKVTFGQRAIAVEGAKRGGIVAEQNRERSAKNVETGYLAFMKVLAPGVQQLHDAYDGVEQNLVPKTEALADEAHAAGLAATAEADQPALELRMLAQRTHAVTEAQTFQEQGHTAFLSATAKDNAAVGENTVLSSPTSYAMVAAGADGLAIGLPMALRKPIVDDYKAGLAEARVKGLMLRGDLTTAKAEVDAGTYDTVLPPKRKTALLDEVRKGFAQRATDLLEAAKYGDEVDPAALEEAAANSGDPGLQAHARYAIAVGDAELPALAALGGSGGGGGGGGGFQSDADFMIDVVEGGDKLVANDGGRGPARFGINQGANPDLNVAKITRAQAITRYKRYWNEVGADRMQPGLAALAFDTAVNMGVATAKRLLAEADYDPARLFVLREDRYRDLATQPEHAGDLKGWMARQDTMRKRVAFLDSYANLEAGLSSDPVKFAAEHRRLGLPTPPPLPDGDSGPAFQGALRQRAAFAAAMAKTYPRTPTRLLSDVEAGFYRDKIGASPMAGIKFAQEAVAALGEPGARALLGEVGQKEGATLELHLADLAAAGLTNFTELAAKGLALKAAKATLPKEEHAKINTIMADNEALFAGAPLQRMAVQATVEAARLADLQLGKTRPIEFYFNSALGGSTRDGMDYGGTVAHANTSWFLGSRQDKTLSVLPTWLAHDYVDDALEHLAGQWAASGKGPVYSNGKPRPAADVAKLHLFLLPTGRYRLATSEGVDVLAPGGAPFEFDLDAARDGLRRALGPKAVLR